MPDSCIGQLDVSLALIPLLQAPPIYLVTTDKDEMKQSKECPNNYLPRK